METNKELLFARTLQAVSRQAKEAGGFIEEEQVREAFSQLELSEEQLNMVFDYLKKHNIGIGEPPDLDEFLSGEEIDYLEEYRRELALLEALSEGEREAVILSAMAGDEQAKNRLIQAYLPQVVEISRLYAGQGVFLEDLIGEGNVALTHGVTLLGCMENAAEADGMLVKMIMDAMEECILNTMEEAEKDKKVLTRVNKVAKQAAELAESLHRKVTPAELSGETGMSEAAIREVMRISGFAIEDLEG